MMFVVRAFRCDRPVWFRTSAIAVGWMLAQILEERQRTGGWGLRLTLDGWLNGTLGF
jgi:hypothetical protein